MPDWSRRRLLAAIGTAGALGGGWYLVERPHCRPLKEPRWTYRGEHWGPPVPAGGTLLLPEGHGVTGYSSHRLVALEPYYGQAHWAVVAEGGGFGVPTRYDDTVYVGTGLDTVRALDAETGDRRWRYDAGGHEEYGGGAWGRPLVRDGRVYVGISHSTDPEADPSDSSEYAHRVVALDPADGSELWATDLTAMAVTGPVFAAGLVVAVSRDGTLRGFDPATGTMRWDVDLPGPVSAPLSVVDERFVSLLTEDGTVAHVDARDGTTRRTHRVADGATSLERNGDTLYVGGDDGRLVAVSIDDADDAPVRWEYDAGEGVEGVAADPEVGTVAVDRTGHVHRVSADGERESVIRIAENDSDDVCGWRGDVSRVLDATIDRGTLYVASRFWTRRFHLDE